MSRKKSKWLSGEAWQRQGDYVSGGCHCLCRQTMKSPSTPEMLGCWGRQEKQAQEHD